MAYESDSDIGTPGNVVPEPADARASVPDPADQRALDELAKQDDAARAKEQEAQERGDESWKKLEEKTAEDDGQPPTELTVPIEVPQHFFPEAEANIREVGVLANELGVPTEEAQTLVDYVVALNASDQSGVSLEDPDACRTVLNRRYGTDGANQVIADAQKAVTRLGPKAADFLNRSGYGNSPAVLVALAAYACGNLRMSPEQAQKELDKLTKGEDLRSAYRSAEHPNHKAAIDRATMLYHIVARGEAKAAAEGASSKKLPIKSGTGERMAALDAEIKSLIHHPAYRDKGHREHATIKARAERAYAERWPGEAGDG
jgi:hypothetical protein